MRQFPLAPQLWGATYSEPQTVTEWRENFAAWLRALSWHLEGDAPDTQRTRQLAAARSLLRAPSPLDVSSDTRAALWRVRGLLSSEPETAQPLDFGDPYTFLLWLDFLGESAKRRAAWRRFKKGRGACEVL